MKALFDYNIPSCRLTENTDEWKDVIYYFKDYSISYDTDKNGNLVILQQKVLLSEFDMNTLFDVLVEYYNIDIFYAALGGEGCDFSIYVREALDKRVE